MTHSAASIVFSRSATLSAQTETPSWPQQTRPVIGKLTKNVITISVATFTSNHWGSGCSNVDRKLTYLIVWNDRYQRSRRGSRLWPRTAPDVSTIILLNATSDFGIRRIIGSPPVCVDWYGTYWMQFMTEHDLHEAFGSCMNHYLLRCGRTSSIDYIAFIGFQHVEVVN